MMSHIRLKNYKSWSIAWLVLVRSADMLVSFPLNLTDFSTFLPCLRREGGTRAGCSQFGCLPPLPGVVARECGRPLSTSWGVSLKQNNKVKPPWQPKPCQANAWNSQPKLKWAKVKLGHPFYRQTGGVRSKWLGKVMKQISLHLTTQYLMFKTLFLTQYLQIKVFVTNL